MAAYYNEIDPHAAAWLRNLIKAGHIAPGDVDERSIEDVPPSDLRPYTQCHFFAGIGVWSHALRRAGWHDDRPVWTGSCPCQPFSAAGKGGGTADERHLFPAWHHLINQCRPADILGEQVASKDGLGWLDLVLTDLEASGYTCGAADICAAGLGAPHIRQRLWIVAKKLAYTDYARLEGRIGVLERPSELCVGAGGLVDRLAYTKMSELERHRPIEGGQQNRLADSGDSCGLADTNGDRCKSGCERCAPLGLRQTARADCGVDELDNIGRPSPVNGFWADADWLFCRDGKWRAVEPGTSPLADGAASRVGRLRAYGNAINAQVAETFIRSYLDVEANPACDLF